MKTEILKMLRQTNDYLSGQQICDTFHVSRTAVWKVITQLKEEGYEIEAVRNRGYRLTSSPDVLSEKEITSRLKTKWAGTCLEFEEVVDSTNIRAKELGEKGAPHGTLVVAEQQTAGKGRRGRSWVSPPGSSIYMTLLLKPEVEPSRAPMLTLLMAYAIADAFRGEKNLDVQIKWPNDLVLNKKKICGILTEMSAEVGYVHYVVIGVGINVNTESFQEEISQTATSLRIEEGVKFQRAELIAAIMQKFEMYYEKFCASGNLSDIMDGYNAILVNKDREVRVLEPGNEYNAKALGINETGELIVEKEDGSRTEIFSGEVSVRGIYGYV
ncbi:MAG: biotin--[acetyl-CoA-carboxylase] ligase [Bariatricus sp.]|nr:biotin--[acetyl-CoA-carboxylase] ligase [Bariatricus sp.]